MSELYVRRDAPETCRYFGIDTRLPSQKFDAGLLDWVMRNDDTEFVLTDEAFRRDFMPLAEYQRTQRDAVIRELIEKYVSVHDTDTDPVLSHNAWITVNTLRAELGAEDAEQGVRHDPAS